MDKYKVKVLKEANMDLQEAIEYYEAQRKNLGLEFFTAYAQTEDRIAENPLAYEQFLDNFRKANLHRFPYSAYYEVAENKQEVTINAVIHQSRNPETIKKKIENSSDKEKK